MTIERPAQSMFLRNYWYVAAGALELGRDLLAQDYILKQLTGVPLLLFVSIKLPPLTIQSNKASLAISLSAVTSHFRI